MPRLRSSFALVAPLAFALACSAPPPVAAEATATAGSPIIGGTASPSAQDAAVLLEDDVDLGGGYECTATLLAPNLVLTARHCVSPLVNDAAFSCDRDGNVTAGDATLGADVDPSHLAVRTGPKRQAPSSPPQARGVRILHDDAKTLCNHDLALVVLDTAIPNATIAPVRLDDTAALGESFTAVGWGITQATTDPQARMQRTVKVVDVGPATDTTLQVEVAPNEFLAGEVTCIGDSGGPALAASGAVMGVVSRGGNGTSSTNLADSCTGSQTVNFFTELAPFKSLVLQAYAAAGADPWLEGQSGPTPLPPDAGAGGGGGSQGGCAVERPRDRSTGAWLLVAAAIATTMARRRRP